MIEDEYCGYCGYYHTQCQCGNYVNGCIGVKAKMCVCGVPVQQESSTEGGEAEYSYKFSYCGDVKCRNAIVDLIIEDLNGDKA